MPRRLLLIHAGPTLPSLARRHGDFDRWFLRALEGVDAAWTIVRPYHGEALPDPAPYSAVLMTGSHASVCDGAPWMADAERWVRDAVERETPFLGVCFGHQLLAHAFGARVVRNPRGLELGTCELALTAEGARDPLFAGLAPPFTAPEAHQDMAVDLPARVRLLASNDWTPVQAIAVGPYARGVQFHPEITPEILSDLALALTGESLPAREASLGAGLLAGFVNRFGRGAVC